MPDDERDAQLPNDAEALRDIREEARQARLRFHRERLRNGQVSDNLKIALTEVAIAYRDLLIDYRDDDVFRPPWDDRDIDWVADLMDERVARRQERAGRGRGAESVEMPACVDVSGRKLYKLLKEFDQMWRQLGLGLPIEEREGPGGMVPDGSIDPEEREA